MLVAAGKLVFGIITKSASMTADGVHSFADGTNNIIGLLGLFISERPIDKTHPYGHQKYETLTALGIGGLLLIMAINLIKDAIMRFGHPVVPEVNVFSFVVMFVCLLINIYVMVYEKSEGEKIGSQILVVDAYHTRSDIFVSLSVIATLVAVILGVPVIDTAVSLGIAIFIGFTALEMFWETSKVLSDAAMIDPGVIRDVILDFKEVESCHKIRTRGRQDYICVDLHVWVNPSMHISKSHELSHKLEKKLMEKFPGVKEVIVHIEPTPKPE